MAKLKTYPDPIPAPPEIEADKLQKAVSNDPDPHPFLPGEWVAVFDSMGQPKYVGTVHSVSYRQVYHSRNNVKRYAYAVVRPSGNIEQYVKDQFVGSFAKLKSEMDIQQRQIDEILEKGVRHRMAWEALEAKAYQNTEIGKARVEFKKRRQRGEI